ncbi:hypothetical protein EQG49_00310 [Periweissella cryptocerci]|uniref:Uncharacterized protein n=1 Tax=Periweissella cryptocerci TaxID=2506420 RepID=A0A4P6YQV8_9LACO|nr:hypothetical protein [Periweissella cryptocerci]QBO34997.1 hypothetical protein EQG49_00310 [Periweissella cryptocerci]
MDNRISMLLRVAELNPNFYINDVDEDIVFTQVSEIFDGNFERVSQLRLLSALKKIGLTSPEIEKITGLSPATQGRRLSQSGLTDDTLFTIFNWGK